MPFLETIKLVSSGALIMGNAPRKVKLSQIANKIANQATTKKHIQSFGLFDNNTSNYNTYYPEVTAKDLKPKKGEFIEPVFRALSEVVVHKEYNPVDFSRGRVLRKSMSLLKAQTVNTDHEDAVGNAIGSVSAVFWQESYKDSNGILIPAGINSRLKIDGKSHPRVARAIMMKPPAIHSTSVTVQFLWEKSHPDMNDENFYKNLGAYDKDSKLITRVAVDIKKYHEISLVSHGADPFAQLIHENGELNNAPFAAISYNSLKPELKKKQKLFSFDFKTDVVKNSKKFTIPEELIIKQSSQTNKGMKKLLALIVSEFGLKEFNPEDTKQLSKLKAKIAKLKDTEGKENLSDETKEKLTSGETAQAELVKLTKRYEKLKATKIARLKTIRKDVLKNYTLAVGGEKDAKVVETIANADEPTLEVLNKDYIKKLELKFPTSCSDCGSTNITKASTKTGDESTDDGPMTDDQIQDSLIGDDLKSSAAYMH